MFLQSLQIERFRSLENLQLADLTAVNVITGGNNAGKTTLLEALYFALASQNQMVQFPTAFRDAQSPKHVRMADELVQHFWKWLFPSRNLTLPVVVQAVTSMKTKLKSELKREGEQNQRLMVRVSGTSENWQLPVMSPQVIPESELEARRATLAVFANKPKNVVAEAERYNTVVVKRGEETLLGLLRSIEPRLEKLRYLKVTSEPLIYADVGLEELIPTSQMGQAFERLLTLYIEMLTSKADVLLIDEIENGLHHTVYKTVWKGIAELAARMNIQVFASTHSRECLQAAHEASFREENNGFSHHRVRSDGGRVSISTSQSILGLEI